MNALTMLVVQLYCLLDAFRTEAKSTAKYWVVSSRVTLSVV